MTPGPWTGRFSLWEESSEVMGGSLRQARAGARSSCPTPEHEGPERRGHSNLLICRQGSAAWCGGPREGFPGMTLAATASGADLPLREHVLRTLRLAGPGRWRAPASWS